MDYLENARRIFKEDYFATEAAGIVIDEVEPGYARCTMPLRKIHKNAAGNVMGGAVFTLADFAFGVAANTEEHTSTVSLTSEIRFVGFSKGSVLTAEARRIREGKSVAFYDVEVCDDLGTLVAKVAMTGARKVFQA